MIDIDIGINWTLLIIFALFELITFLLKFRLRKTSIVIYICLSVAYILFIWLDFFSFHAAILYFIFMILKNISIMFYGVFR